MLTLEPNSLCDVCANEFGPRNLPHSIPCGHVLCLSCCTNIIEKTQKAPVCPFCREGFSRSSVRKIRFDFSGHSTSGWTTPRRSPLSPRAPLIEDDYEPPLKPSHNHGPDESEVKARIYRQLESKVARVATKKTSVDEVSTLHREIQDWLNTDNGHSDASSSLYLSALLLRAILANHFAFSEATKAAKTVEATLHKRVDDLEREKGHLELELHRQKTQYAQKAQECQNLRSELSRFRATPATTTASAASTAHTGLSSSIPRPASTRPTTSAPTTPHTSPPVSPPSTRVSSPTSMTPSFSHLSNLASPLTRLASGHYRSASVAPGRSTTPAVSSLPRSATPAASSASSPHALRPSTGPFPPRATTPAVHPTHRVGTPVSPTPLSRTKGRTFSVSGPAPSTTPTPADHQRWLANNATANASSRPQGPRLATRG